MVRGWVLILDLEHGSIHEHCCPSVEWSRAESCCHGLRVHTKVDHGLIALFYEVRYILVDVAVELAYSVAEHSDLFSMGDWFWDCLFGVLASHQSMYGDYPYIIKTPSDSCIFSSHVNSLSS